MLLCCVSLWFWREIGVGLHTLVLRVQYSCGVVLVFWFWREIVFGFMYILSVRYLSVMSKYEHHQSHFNLRKFLLGFFFLLKQCAPNFLLVCISFLLCMDLQPYSHDCFSKISRTLFDFLNNTYWVFFILEKQLTNIPDRGFLFLHKTL